MMRISRDFKMTDTINYERNMFEIVMANWLNTQLLEIVLIW
jgi:hypothetical protein